MRTSPLPHPAAVTAFCVLQGVLAAVYALSLAVLCLSAAYGCWANLPSIFVFAVGSGHHARQRVVARPRNLMPINRKEVPMTRLNHAPLLTADDEPTAKHDMAALTGAARASVPSMVPYPAPMVTAPVFKLPLLTRLRHWLASWLLGDTWNERRVIAAAIRQFKLEREWDTCEDGDPAKIKLRAWKDSQLELEHATHALLVARGKR